ncbi:MAG: hypothetical protein Q9183_006117 [Haloplaca sp. 2 TL-2023]
MDVVVDQDAEGESDSLTAAPIQGARRPQAPIVDQPQGPMSPPLSPQPEQHDPPIPPPSTSAIARLGSPTAAPSELSSAPEDPLTAPSAEGSGNQPGAAQHGGPADAVDPSEPPTPPNIRRRLRDVASLDESGYAPGEKDAERRTRRARKQRKQRLNWRGDVIGSTSPSSTDSEEVKPKKVKGKPRGRHVEKRTEGEDRSDSEGGR